MENAIELKREITIGDIMSAQEVKKLEKELIVFNGMRGACRLYPWI